MTWLKRLLALVSLLSCALVAAFFLLGPQWVDRNSNQVLGDPGRAPTSETRAFHEQLIVGDLHADSALWGKDLLHRNDWGQVDLPRLIEGGATLQMFTTVTKSPRGQNYEQNATDTADNITLLAMAQRWPAEPMTAFSPERCCKPTACKQRRAESATHDDHHSGRPERSAGPAQWR